MKHITTEIDKSILLQPILNYQYRIIVADDEGRTLDTIYNASDISSFSIDGSCGIRRTFSLSLAYANLGSTNRIVNTWLPLNFILQIGMENIRNGEYVWYDCGVFVMAELSDRYDSANNNIELKFADWFSKLDGTRNGRLGGAPTILIPNTDHDGNNVTVKSALTTFIQAEGIGKYIVEDLGEFYGMQSNNPGGYLEYRKSNPDWDKLPYDLEFSADGTVADIISTFIELYPNAQAYFDIYNNLCVNMIPSCEYHPVELNNDFIQQILVRDNSENVSYDIQSIYNITEVFGKTYNIDRLSESCSTSGSTYSIILDSYDKYSSHEYIAFTPNTANGSKMYLRINSLSSIPIYQEYTTAFIPSNTMVAGELYVIQIKRTDDGSYAAYFLGQYQPHALCVLTDDLSDTHFTKQYFMEKYNCSNVTLREESGSPFTVQRIGEILDVKSGAEFDNILSDTAAMENSIYYNRKSSSMNDTIGLTTKLVPWLDILCKVEYKKAQDSEANPYLVQSITHNVSNGTSTITLSRFYPLYYD